MKRHAAMTNTVQKAATKSSNMMPNPPRTPKPLKDLSAQATGPGLTASKKRNNAKATNCPQKPAGVTSHSTSQKATTSSHTILPGSDTCICLAVKVQAHHPVRSDAVINNAHWVSFIWSCNSQNVNQAHKVPEVPGAKRLKPEPNPNAMMCAGCDHIKRAEGLMAWPFISTGTTGMGGKSGEVDMSLGV